jgi:hypothetical protein
VRLSDGTHRAIRVSMVLAVAAGLGLLNHRMRRSPEQVELTRYVEREVPSLIKEEQRIVDELGVLYANKTLTPTLARSRLVDELQPRLTRLRHRAEALSPSTMTVRQLAADYLGVLDAWIETVRTAVRAIDDPKVTTEAAFASVREHMADAAGADQRWRARVVQTCEHHRLAKPALTAQ